MKQFIFLSLVLFLGIHPLFAQNDYYQQQAERYQREAEYYQRKADSYRNEAAYYLKKAQSYQREVEYYTKRGDIDKAKTYMRYVENQMDKYQTTCATHHKLMRKPLNTSDGQRCLE